MLRLILDLVTLSQMQVIHYMGRSIIEMTNLRLARLSEKLFLRSGIVLSPALSTSDNSEQKIFINIPLQVEYIMASGFIRPKIAYGYTMYFPNFDLITTLNFGGNIRLTKQLFISVSSEFQFYPKLIPLIPGDTFASALQIGLFKSIE